MPLVVLPTSVTDSKGHFIEGLAASDFLLLDDGKVRAARIDASDFEFAPIALVVVIQTNDLSLSALAKIRKIGAMIPEAVVGANGEAAIVTFAERTTVLQDFTTDPDAISKAFQNLKPTDASEHA